jgi:hypothetical protein
MIQNSKPGYDLIEDLIKNIFLKKLTFFVSK